MPESSTQIHRTVSQEAHLTMPPAPIDLPHSPDSIEELVSLLTAAGIESKPIEFTPCGGRQLAHLGRLKVGEKDCIAKFAGTQLDPDHDEYFLYMSRERNVELERNGLQLVNDLAPKLVNEMYVNGKLVGILREFVDAEQLITTIHTKVSFEDALRRALDLADNLARRGARLFDHEPGNLFLSQEGRVILIEGACVIADDRTPDEIAKANRRLVAEILDDWRMPPA